MLRWILFISVLLVIEIYAFQAFKTAIKHKWIVFSYQMLSIAVIIYVIYSLSQFDRAVGQNRQSLITFGLILLTLLPKIIIMVILFGEDIWRIIYGIYGKFSDKNNGDFLPERRKFVSQTALGIAAIPFLSLIYGMTIGKYNFKVRKQTIQFPDLPDSFDGFKILQISDIHSGSFDSTEKIEYAIDLINQQEADIILFTGDIVNTHATEMHPWIDTFKKIKTPEYGKFSVLGNHDYGEYITWPTKQAKLKNFEDIKDLHQMIDFKLLLNENLKLKKGNEEIALVGVENWGVGFKQAGDLAKASEGLTQKDFKILMSHDPSHWDFEVKNHAGNYQLTLSGHTHGFQFGIEIPGFIKWSPVQYRYPQWAGLYETNKKYLYVNRGFGFHAYPGRVGIMPEITVLELKKSGNIS
ncbi:metallophosphoesterase [Flavobacterium sp. NST-5]|uniref:Metallophosphoesterase n=1 Tax=Flavobacterium ichthyis TaxID=2698827 RepID=A0ABW9Z6M1_9FLAO|nr:metallophosphoesterase [Flavobacterium ichthyis]NBL63770.1 metallophosphoesterase [Flavobacterium ichthyis]